MMACKDHGCTKSLYAEGYAKKWHKRQLVGLHRLVYCQSKGIPLTDITGLVIRHTCDNPRCIEPTHLILGTQADNMQDMSQRGRAIRHKLRQLTDTEVDAIRKRYDPARINGKVPNGIRALARDYNINSGSISHILAGRSYKHNLQGAEGVKS